jgi:hypothetical protein
MVPKKCIPTTHKNEIFVFQNLEAQILDKLFQKKSLENILVLSEILLIIANVFSLRKFFCQKFKN